MLSSEPEHEAEGLRGTQGMSQVSRDSGRELLHAGLSWVTQGPSSPTGSSRTSLLGG